MNKNRFRGQFTIADILLALTVVAAWTAFAVSEARVERLNVQMRSLQRAAGELIISDPTQYNAIAQSVPRHPDEAWRVHLPPGQTYQLNLVTREIQSDGFPGPKHVTSVAPGLHRIELRHARDSQNAPRFIVVVDEQIKIEAQESTDWNQSGGSSSIGVGKSQEVAPTDKPFVLKRLRANVAGPSGSSQSPPNDQPANGVLLWITAEP